MLAQAFGTTGPSSKAAVETCAALVQQGLGLDDADEDANTLILERCIAAPGHAAALRILERTIQEASPRVLGDRFPRASTCIEAGLASPSSAVAACRAALALTGEVESEPARQHVAKRLVPAVAAILTAAALAGGDGRLRRAAGDGTRRLYAAPARQAPTLKLTARPRRARAGHLTR